MLLVFSLRLSALAGIILLSFCRFVFFEKLICEAFDLQSIQCKLAAGSNDCCGQAANDHQEDNNNAPSEKVGHFECR